MKRLFWTAPFAVLALAGCGDMPEDAATAEAAGPPVVVTSLELAQAFAANEMAAQQQYGDRTLIVSGTVQSIELDFMDNPVVMLPGTDQFSNVQASLAEESHAAAAGLQKGQSVSVTCTDLSEVIGTPMLGDCTL